MDYQPLGPSHAEKKNSRSLIAAIVFSLAGLFIVGSFLGRNGNLETEIGAPQIDDLGEEAVGGANDWDTFILIDDSGSVSMEFDSKNQIIRNNNYDLFKDFLAQWMNDGIIAENSYVGIGRFGELSSRSGARPETIPIDFPMERMNQQRYIDAICGLNYAGGLTYTDVGIHDAVEVLKTRGGAKKRRLIIVTDGNPTGGSGKATTGYFPCTGKEGSPDYQLSHNQYYTSADALAGVQVEVQIIGVTEGFRRAPLECLIKADAQIQAFGNFKAMFDTDSEQIAKQIQAASKSRQEIQCQEINDKIKGYVKNMKAASKNQGSLSSGQHQAASDLKEAQDECGLLVHQGVCKLQNGENRDDALEDAEHSGFQYCHAYDGTDVLGFTSGEVKGGAVGCNTVDLQNMLPAMATFRESKCQKDNVKLRPGTTCTVHKKGHICNPSKIKCDINEWSVKAQIECQDISTICSGGERGTAVSEDLGH